MQTRLTFLWKQSEKVADKEIEKKKGKRKMELKKAEWTKRYRRYAKDEGEAEKFMKNEILNESKKESVSDAWLIKYASDMAADACLSGDTEECKKLTDVILFLCHEKKKEKERSAKKEKIHDAESIISAWGVPKNIIQMLHDCGYFGNVGVEDLDDLKEDTKNGYGMLKLSANGITVALVQQGPDSCIMAFDPSSCYVKPLRCSVIVHFPAGKRESETAEKIFEKINEKGEYRRNWVKSAPTSWCGEWHCG